MQRPYTISFLLVLEILAALGFCGWFAYTRRWRLAIVPAVATLFLGVLALYTDAHTIAHKANQMIQEPVTYMHDVASHFTLEKEKHDQFGAYQLFAGLVTNVIAINIDFKGAQAAVIGLAAEKAGLSWSEHLAKIHDAAVDQRFEALDSKVGAIQPVVHIAMFHEVAITQKIIVIGVNQFM